MVLGVPKEVVEAAIRNKLKPTYLNVVDMSAGDGASYVVEVVSAAFEGKGRVERHRLVHSSIAEELKHIHAFSLKKALTPQEWQEEDQISPNV